MPQDFTNHILLFELLISTFSILKNCLCLLSCVHTRHNRIYMRSGLSRLRFHRDLIEAVLDETDSIQTGLPVAQC